MCQLGHFHEGCSSSTAIVPVKECKWVFNKASSTPWYIAIVHFEVKMRVLRTDFCVFRMIILKVQDDRQCVKWAFFMRDVLLPRRLDQRNANGCSIRLVLHRGALRCYFCVFRMIVMKIHDNRRCVKWAFLMRDVLVA